MIFVGPQIMALLCDECPDLKGAFGATPHLITLHPDMVQYETKCFECGTRKVKEIPNGPSK